MSNDVVVYHGNCVDGICGAALADMGLCYVNSYVPVMIEGHYGSSSWKEKLPEHIDKLFFVDFSTTPEILKELSEIVQEIVILDHHRSAIEKLEHATLPQNVKLVLDENKCGARLALEHFKLYCDMPKQAGVIVDYVEDRDLWKWELEESKEVSAWLGSIEKTTSYWQTNVFQDNIASMASKGRAILKKEEQQVQEALKHQHFVFSFPAVNSCNNQSEIGHRLSEKYEGKPVIVYYITGDRVVGSVRSGDGQAKKVAEMFGGGGHPNAAGFNMRASDFLIEGGLA